MSGVVLVVKSSRFVGKSAGAKSDLLRLDVKVGISTPSTSGRFGLKLMADYGDLSSERGC